MSAQPPAWTAPAYPANVRPNQLAQVDHGRRLIFVLADQLDSTDPVLSVFYGDGRYAKRKVLRAELAFDGNAAATSRGNSHAADCQPDLFGASQS